MIAKGVDAPKGLCTDFIPLLASVA